MRERLCPICQSYGKCLFREHVDNLVRELEDKNISDPEMIRMAAGELHQRITSLGKQMINIWLCPYGTYSPNYPGKESLNLNNQR